jgi:GTPase SAR1 family protein
VLEAEVPKLLLGNKCDLKERLTQEEEVLISEYCQKNNMKYFKVSAKTGENVTNAYNTLVEEAYAYSYNHRKGSTVPVVIGSSDKKRKKKKKPCC